MKYRLKNNSFDAIQVTGESNQFSELKHFCGDNIRISYEICSIEDYWNIALLDSATEEFKVVPNGYYIVRLGFARFIMLSAEEFESKFEETL